VVDAKRLIMSRLGRIMQHASSHIMKKLFPLIHSRLNSGAWTMVMLVVIEALSAFLSGSLTVGELTPGSLGHLLHPNQKNGPQNSQRARSSSLPVSEVSLRRAAWRFPPPSSLQCNHLPR
jgi:hypothetical protein